MKFSGIPVDNKVVVLILIVVEERIGSVISIRVLNLISCLNPYCSGRKNRIVVLINSIDRTEEGLNPYCSGRKNRIRDLRITLNGFLRLS